MELVSIPGDRDASLATHRYRAHTKVTPHTAHVPLPPLINCSQAHSDECDTACLVDKTPAEIHAAWDKCGNDIPDIILANFGHWLSAALATTPTIDGDWVKNEPMDAITKVMCVEQQYRRVMCSALRPLTETRGFSNAQGIFADNIDVLMGSNENEGVTFVFAAFPKTEIPTVLYEGWF